MTRIKSATLPKSELGNDPNDFIDDPEYVGKIEPEPSALERLKKLSVTNRITEMEANLKNDVFIFPDLALSGQITLFYAWPSTGKTIFFLRFMRDAIESGQLKGDDVFYINADDSYKGLLTKAKVAEKFGFSMISPSEAGISPQIILDMLVEISADDDANGKIILLDTLKKFADMMSKNSQKELYEILRRFIAKGGTVIIAGHANKHKSPDGNLIYEGTSDTMNDVDCVYSMYRMSEPEDESQVVEFRREKDRGDVIAKISYKYQKIPGYMDMVNSITCMDDNEVQRIITETQHKELKEKHEFAMLFVSSLLEIHGSLNQSAIINALAEDESINGEITKRGLITALKQLTGVVWSVKRGEKYALIYSLIGADADEYRKYSRGE